MNARIAVLAAVSVSICAAALSAPAVGAARTYLPDCAYHSDYKPGTIVVYCADAGLVLKHMHWSSWGSSTARGTTHYAYTKSCDPNCASGGVERYRARVVLQRARTCPSTGKHVFTRLYVIYENKPAGVLNISQKVLCRNKV